MRYVLYCLLAVNYLLALNARFAVQSTMGAITSTERFLIGLAPALFVLLFALGFRRKARESFGCLGILAIVLCIAFLMYSFTPAIQ